MVELFGENVFSIKTMRNYLSESAYKSLVSTLYQGKSLKREIADEVADAMKTWALEKGATHFTHWFQPLTGATAEKHDSFIMPDREGGAITRFSGSELIRGEPDASSFPSGGLRATFEARGYTAWDPTSPAFIKEGKNGATLCIPTVFCAYHGEALDKKTPLLRSIEALSRQVCRLGNLFGINCDGKRARADLGAEQEYFLIDKKFYDKRLDLLQTGRTLFGRKPAKHQQMEDHYFGAIKPRVMTFMCDVDRELWRLGVPAKTRHNEVCPGQFEIAPVYEELNLAVDHNMIVMEVLREMADRHGFACLLHEKPFAGVNGSGKHNNWSLCGPDGKNWLTPGDNPHENAKFLTIICALMKAVDTRAKVLRATVATAGNDHRLGANEAPPAILSIFLGDQLTDVILQIEQGTPKSSKKRGPIEIGVSSLPSLPRDATDRNRTSPLAFTGNKFEFRAVGSNQSCAGSNVALNTIVAEALDEICTRLEKAVAGGRDFNESLQAVLKDIVGKHKRIIFNGDNYSPEWRREAARRGLPSLKRTPESLKAFVDPDVIKMFAKYGVLSERELRSRYEVYQDAYDKTVAIEAECALTIAKTLIAPAALEYEGRLARMIRHVALAGKGPVAAKKKLLAELSVETERLLKCSAVLETNLGQRPYGAVLKAMNDLREAADALEGLVPDHLWPLPSYAEMMFMM
ncbi:MAG: glutamine synthetase III [Verrucomicrobia bacterium]|nr:glutamine synthetase III [Verrucomicrobiota bacterium]MBU4247963.1 glutamine synthetase III [Verrucomicrobiota bacterium]MBU4291460.1 glutamine synthetase III [Verrucomicrobiota bacterium]MBU4496434.1 glutamine synthetase III [Verrucomicrobiota bacterium]